MVATSNSLHSNVTLHMQNSTHFFQIRYLHVTLSVSLVAHTSKFQYSFLNVYHVHRGHLSQFEFSFKRLPLGSYVNVSYNINGSFVKLPGIRQLRVVSLHIILASTIIALFCFPANSLLSLQLRSDKIIQKMCRFNFRKYMFVQMTHIDKHLCMFVRFISACL